MKRIVAVLGIVLTACAPSGVTPDLAPGATSVPGPPATPPVVSSSMSPGAPAADVPTTSAPTTTEPPASPLLGIEVEVLASGLATPVGVVTEPVSGMILAIEQAGRLAEVHPGAGTWFDISDRVRSGGERGLLDVAFHPAWPEVGRLFVHYTASDGSTTVSEFAAPGGVPDPASEQVLYRVAQPAGNHNGGPLLFLPDGTLLLALGDGGGANDRFGNGRRTDTPLAALLRFDVSVPGMVRPAEGNPGFEVAEMWAYGLRNPWQVAYDDGRLWVADVGQDRYEEVSVVPWTRAGVDFGWPVTEGAHCFAPTTGCDDSGQVLPVVEVEHGDEGTCSITGGLVYRGLAFPEWEGAYLFSDYCGGWLRSYRVGEEVVSWSGLVGGTLGNVTGFGADLGGEVLVVVADGRILRLQPER